LDDQPRQLTASPSIPSHENSGQTDGSAFASVAATLPRRRRAEKHR
jgi:hypothetical protein